MILPAAKTGPHRPEMVPQIPVPRTSRVRMCGAQDSPAILLNARTYSVPFLTAQLGFPVLPIRYSHPDCCTRPMTHGQISAAAAECPRKRCGTQLCRKSHRIQGISPRLRPVVSPSRPWRQYG